MTILDYILTTLFFIVASLNIADCIITAIMEVPKLLNSIDQKEQKKSRRKMLLWLMVAALWLGVFIAHIFVLVAFKVKLIEIYPW